MRNIRKLLICIFLLCGMQYLSAVELHGTPRGFAQHNGKLYDVRQAIANRRVELIREINQESERRAARRGRLNNSGSDDNDEIDRESSILTEPMIKELAKSIEKAGGGQYKCHAEGRTLVFDFLLLDESFLKEFETDKIAGSLENEFSALYASNFIDIRYDLHYKDKVGIDRTKQVFLRLPDLLNFNSETKEKYSTKGHKKALGVNLTMLKPKGWKAKEGDGPHIVQNFEYKQGTNYVSYMIYMKDLPTFFSKREAKEILEGGEKYGIKYEDFGKDFLGGNIDVLSSTMDVVGNYPARRIEYKMSAERSGVTINIYGVSWMIFYEDVYVVVGGSVNTHDQNAMPMFGHMFDLITNNVRFYDQYNDKNYGK